MAVISFAKGVLSEEAINLIHTTAGIFGAYLKDLFAFEFGGFPGGASQHAEDNSKKHSPVQQPTCSVVRAKATQTPVKMIKDR